MPIFSCHPLKLEIEIDSLSSSDVYEVVARHLRVDKANVVIFDDKNKVLEKNKILEPNAQLHGGVVSFECEEHN